MEKTLKKHLKSKKHMKKRSALAPSFTFSICFKVFKQSYTFVEEIKSKEREQLKKELDKEEDQERIKQIKYLIQRMVKHITVGI